MATIVYGTFVRWHEPALLFTVELDDGTEIMCRLSPTYLREASIRVFDVDLAKLKKKMPRLGKRVRIRRSDSGLTGVILHADDTA